MSGGRETFSPPPVLCSYIRIQVDSLFFFFFFFFSRNWVRKACTSIHMFYAFHVFFAGLEKEVLF